MPLKRRDPDFETSENLATLKPYQQYQNELASQGQTFDPRVGSVVTQDQYKENHKNDSGKGWVKALALGGMGALMGGPLLGGLGGGGGGAAAATVPAIPTAVSGVPAGLTAATVAGHSMSPGLGSIISSLIGFGGGLLDNGPDPQRKSSFAGVRGADPREILQSLMRDINGAGQGAVKQLGQGVKLRSMANSSVGFKNDPASIDPSLLTKPGIDLGPMFGDPLASEQAVPRAPGSIPTRLRTRQ